MEASRKKSHLVLAEKTVLTRRKKWQHFKKRNEYTPKKKKKSGSIKRKGLMRIPVLLCPGCKETLSRVRREKERENRGCQRTLAFHPTAVASGNSSIWVSRRSVWTETHCTLVHTSFASCPRFSPTPQ